MKTPGPSNEKEPSAKINKSNNNKNNKKKSCNWSEDAIKSLLAFLIERKEEVNNLSTKRGGSGNTKAKLWQDASAIFLNDDNCKYSAEQCANKWKNVKKNYKDDMDHNKQSGNDPVEVRYKTEVEEILDGNRPSLTPKVLNSSLNLDDLDNEEEAAPFDEITGRNKRKNESSEFNQEEKPRKAHRSEVRQVKNLLEDLMYQRMEEQEYKRDERKRREVERKQREEQRQREFSLLISALHPSNNTAPPPTNHVPFYYRSTSFDLMQTTPPQINATHINNATQINAARINTAQINNILPSQIRSPSPPHFDEC